MIRISEIFSTVQGEGMWVGSPATFIRFHGCSVECSFCDTKKAWKDKEFTDFTIEDLVKAVKEHGNRHVVITGGEPLEQSKGLFKLYQQLKDEYFVSLETSGIVDPKGFDERIFTECPDLWITLSPKRSEVHPLLLPNVSEFKFLIELSESQTLLIPDILQYVQEKRGILFFQPVYGKNNACYHVAILKAIEHARIYGGRLSVQLHKHIGID